MKYTYIISFLFFTITAFSKDNDVRKPIKIKAIETSKNISLSNVFIVNMSTYKGGITNNLGEITIYCKAKDSLLISRLGYQKEKICITENNMTESILYIYMSIENYALDEVTIKPHNLTGILDVDLKIVEQRSYPAYIKLRGIKTKEELSKSSNKYGYGYGGVIGYFYSKFSSKVKEIEKLETLKKDDEGMYFLLKQRNDRELVSEVVGLDKDDIEQVLIENNYPPEFVIKATDLEILNALKECFKKKK